MSNQYMQIVEKNNSHNFLAHTISYTFTCDILYLVEVYGQEKDEEEEVK